MHGVIHLLPEKNQPSASDSLVECMMNIANEKQTFTVQRQYFYLSGLLRKVQRKPASQ